jgi:hypothetical protein
MNDLLGPQRILEYPIPFKVVFVAAAVAVAPIELLLNKPVEAEPIEI